MSLVVAVRALILCPCLQHHLKQQAQQACLSSMQRTLWGHCYLAHSVLVPLPDQSLDGSWCLSLWYRITLMPLHDRVACLLIVQHLPM